MIFENISAKQFTFIGLAMIGASIIILIAFFSNPYPREAFLKHESCLQKYAEMIYDMDYKKDIMTNEDEIIKNATITNICSRLAPDPGVQFAELNRVILSIPAFLLVIGVIMSLSGTGHWLVSKFKKKR